MIHIFPFKCGSPVDGKLWMLSLQIVGSRQLNLQCGLVLQLAYCDYLTREPPFKGNADFAPAHLTYAVYNQLAV